MAVKRQMKPLHPRIATRHLPSRFRIPVRGNSAIRIPVVPEHASDPDSPFDFRFAQRWLQRIPRYQLHRMQPSAQCRRCRPAVDYVWLSEIANT